VYPDSDNVPVFSPEEIKYANYQGDQVHLQNGDELEGEDGAGSPASC
jgi:hypothetical protein